MSWRDVEPPEGWAQSTLDEAAQLVKSKVDPSTVPEARYIGLEHVEAQSMRILGSGRGADVKSTKTTFSAGDVLYGKLRPYLNKVARPDFDGIASTDFLAFRESEQLDGGYLAHYLNQLWVADGAHQLSAGVELPRVDWKSLSQLPITFPPSKSAQRAIVRQIEAAKVSSTNVASRLAAAKNAIERFRQAVLAAACSGRLTADWRETKGVSRAHAEAVLALASSERRRILSRKYREFDPPLPYGQLHTVPSEWKRTTIGNVTELVTKGSSPAWQGYDYQSSGVVFLRSQNVRWGYVDLNDVAYLSTDFNAKHLSSVIRKDDVLLNLVGASVGRAATAPEELAGANLNQAVSIIRPVLGVIPEFLMHYLLSPFGQEHIHSQKADVARANFNLDDIKAMPIPLPSTEEQHEIVRRVDRLLNIADSLNQRISSANRRVERSSQAVLAKAFRGDLLLAGDEQERTH